jgi:hypothetical protein
MRSNTRVALGALAGALAAALLLGGMLAAISAGAARPTYARPTYLTFVANPQSEDPSVAIANAHGGDVRRLGHGSLALISPDGGSVAVVRTTSTRSGSNSTLSLYPSGGGSARVLYRSTDFISLFGWSADSNLLLVYTPGGLKDTGPLMSIDAKSGVTHTIAKGAIGGASFSEQGSDDVVYSLAQSMQTTAPGDIYTSSATGSHVNQITAGGNSTDPLWGPKGIVFVRQSSRGTGKAPLYELWFIEPSGAGARQLTHMSVGPLVDGLVPVAFSVTGSHLLADFQGTDTSAAWTVDLSSAKPVVRDLDGIADGNVPDGISRNGETILIDKGFEGTPYSLETIPWGGGKPTVLVKHGGEGSWNY